MYSLVLFLCILKLNECRFYNRLSDSEYGALSRQEKLRQHSNEYEIVHMPTALIFQEAVSETGETSVEADLEFRAFGRQIGLKLKPNTRLTSPAFKTFLVDAHDNRTFLPFENDYCHYTAKDVEVTAALSLCEPESMQGFLLLDNSILEILPLTPSLQTILKIPEASVTSSHARDTVPHIIKRATFTPPVGLTPQSVLDETDSFKQQQEPASNRPVNYLTLELALFFDAEAYKIFAPYFDYNDEKIRNMLLAYTNAIQALYHQTSLGIGLQLVLVRMDIMKSQPASMPHYDGERSQLLDSFCEYQQDINTGSDDNPNHWDMGLYVSGLDFFAFENGRKSGVTMGLATVGGVCIPQYACVIAEFGTTNMLGKPYPSAGFTSVYISAHEIGHNLGMHHDSVGNNCPKEGYIMSPSRGVHGETQWSTCSAEVMTKLDRAKCLHDSAQALTPQLDHSKFSDTPGQIYTVKKQCEILLQDKDASMDPLQQLSGVCQSIQCKTPHRSGFYYAGPALVGTECGNGMYCFGGECVSKTILTPVSQKPGGWGPWKLEECTSGCLEKSVGHQRRHRICNNPTPVNTDHGCEGTSYDVVLCNDEKLCQKKSRKSSNEFASSKCKDFAKLLPKLDHFGVGFQAPHEEGRVWMACAIFCKRNDSNGYYTPRVELNDLGVSPYFPDGTWCHNNKQGENHYCLQHHCLPESFQFSKKPKIFHGNDDDFNVPQNAHPVGEISQGLQSYFSLSPDGKPLQTKIKTDEMGLPKEEDWETKDYRELPDNLNEIPNDDLAQFDFI